ncbi:MAG: aldose epimerase family protein [Planctomycetaceae bacterium]
MKRRLLAHVPPAAVAAALLLAGTIVRAAPSESRPMPPSFAPPAVKPFGKLPDGREAKLYVLEVPGGWRAEITDYGAIVTRMLVPAADGPPVDVVLGFDDLAGYLAGSPYFGAICGRVSNRIAGGTFDLDGKTHTLAKNNGANHLHGGVVGFDKKLWKAAPRVSERGPAVDFELVSPAGDEGYPGRLVARATYTLTPAGELRVEMSATTDAPTIVNMVHHSYWNLAGHASGPVRGHVLAVHADRYLPVDAGSIPTGAQADVAGTPFDFRPGRSPAATLGVAIDGLPAAADGTNPGGVDHDFVIREWKPDGALRPVAVLTDPASGRSLEILSDMPGVQVYTGNYLDGTLRGKAGAVYAKHAGICLETQFHPDSVHHPEWPSPRLEPGSTYRHTMVHRFTPR